MSEAKDRVCDLCTRPMEELLMLEAVRLIKSVMAEQGVSQRELARRLGVSEPRVSRLLDDRNTTLKTLARVGQALGVRFHLRDEPL